MSNIAKRIRNIARQIHNEVLGGNGDPIFYAIADKAFALAEELEKKLQEIDSLPAVSSIDTAKRLVRNI